MRILLYSLIYICCINISLCRSNIRGEAFYLHFSRKGNASRATTKISRITLLSNRMDCESVETVEPKIFAQ